MGSDNRRPAGAWRTQAKVAVGVAVAVAFTLIVTVARTSSPATLDQSAQAPGRLDVAAAAAAPARTGLRSTANTVGVVDASAKDDDDTSVAAPAPDDDDDDDGVLGLAASSGGAEAGSDDDDDQEDSSEATPAPPLVYNAWDDGKVMSDADMDALPSWVWTTKKISPSFRIRLYPKKTEHISRQAKHSGYYGPLPEVKHVLADTKNGLVVDCGANLGFVTLFSAALGHRVRAFEAQADNHRMLLSSLRLNKGFESRVRLYHRAAHWDKTPMKLAHHWVEQKGRGNSGIATLADVGKMDAAGRDRVEAQYELVYPAAVDDVVEPTEYVDLLKIDVEGCQCHVLRSAKRTLQEHRVKYIMIEVTPMNVCGCDHEASMNELLDLGYAPFEAVVSRSGKVSKKKVERAALLSGAVRDVIFVGREFAKPAED